MPRLPKIDPDFSSLVELKEHNEDWLNSSSWWKSPPRSPTHSDSPPVSPFAWEHESVEFILKEEDDCHIAKLAMILEKKKLRKTRISPFNKKSGSLLGRMATMEEEESPTSADIEESNQVVVTRARPQRANSRKATYVLSDDDSEDAATAAVDLDSVAAEYSISDVADDDSDFN